MMNSSASPESWTKTPEDNTEDLESQQDEHYQEAKVYVGYYLPRASDGLEMAAMGMLNDQKEDLENQTMRQAVIERLQLSESEAVRLDEFANQLMIDRGWKNKNPDNNTEVTLDKFDNFDAMAENFDYQNFQSSLVNLLETLNQSEINKVEKAEHIISFLKQWMIVTEDNNEVLPLIKATSGYGMVKVSDIEKTLREIAKDPSVGVYDALSAADRVGRLPTGSGDLSSNQPYNSLLNLIFNNKQ